VPPFDDPHFYDRVAPAYALAQRLLPMWPAYMRRALPWLADAQTVLEIGPGPGTLLVELARNHHLVIGLDLSQGMLCQAAARLRRARLAMPLIQADALALPFAQGSLDAVVLTFALSAIARGDAAVAETARVLRPGGVVAIVDDWLPKNHRAGRAVSSLWTRWGSHIHDARALFMAAGLHIVTVEEFGAFHCIRLAVARRPQP